MKSPTSCARREMVSPRAFRPSPPAHSILNVEVATTYIDGYPVAANYKYSGALIRGDVGEFAERGALR